MYGVMLGSPPKPGKQQKSYSMKKTSCITFSVYWVEMYDLKISFYPIEDKVVGTVETK